MLTISHLDPAVPPAAFFHMAKLKVRAREVPKLTRTPNDTFVPSVAIAGIASPSGLAEVARL